MREVHFPIEQVIQCVLKRAGQQHDDCSLPSGMTWHTLAGEWQGQWRGAMLSLGSQG